MGDQRRFDVEFRFGGGNDRHKKFVVDGHAVDYLAELGTEDSASGFFGITDIAGKTYIFPKSSILSVEFSEQRT